MEEDIKDMKANVDLKILISDFCIFKCKVENCFKECEEIKQLKNLLTRYKQQNKVINEMAEQLVGLPIYDEKEVMVFFMNNEEVKEYFTNKVEREGK